MLFLTRECSCRAGRAGPRRTCNICLQLCGKLGLGRSPSNHSKDPPALAQTLSEQRFSSFGMSCQPAVRQCGRRSGARVRILKNNNEGSFPFASVFQHSGLVAPANGYPLSKRHTVRPEIKYLVRWPRAAGDPPPPHFQTT